MEEEEEKEKDFGLFDDDDDDVDDNTNVDAWVETESIVLERDNECDVVRAIAWSKRSDGIAIVREFIFGASTDRAY